ncbi:MAG: adenylate kinase family protein, partial [Actinomycetota bacterium]
MAGSPGAGKGTHGRRLGADLGIPHIATGDLLREQVAQGTAIGRQVKDLVDRGDYVPDALMMEIIR